MTITRSSAPTTSWLPRPVPPFTPGTNPTVPTTPGRQQREHRRHDAVARACATASQVARRAAQGSGASHAKRSPRRPPATCSRILDADCRARSPGWSGLSGASSRSGARCTSGPYRFYDWDWVGRTADPRLRPAGWRRRRNCSSYHTSRHRLDALRRQLRRPARPRSTRIGGFDTAIEFHGEDTNLGRRLTRDRPRSTVPRLLAVDIGPALPWRWASAAVFRLYVRNFWSELLHHRPRDRQHVDVRI